MSKKHAVEKKDTDKTIEEILAERQKSYGGFRNVAKTSQAFKEVLHNMPQWGNFPSALKETCEMMVHKISRAGNGDYTLLDTWHDNEGYARLAVEEVKLIESRKEVCCEQD